MRNDTLPDGIAHPPARVTQASSSSDLTQGGVDLRDIASKIESITSKLVTKDMEIELLSTEVKTAYIPYHRITSTTSDGTRTKVLRER